MRGRAWARISAAFRFSTALGSSRRPSHSSSWRSAFHASAASEPSISKWRQFLRPALTCETVNAPRAPPSKWTSTWPRSSVVIGASARSTSAALENVSTSPIGLCRTGIGVQVGAHLDDCWPVTNCDQIHPVRADVGDGSQRRRPSPARAASSSRCRRAASPAGSCRARRDVADLTVRHRGAGLLHERIVAEVEVRSRGRARCPRRGRPARPTRPSSSRAASRR